MLLLWIKVDSFIPVILPNLNPICHLLALGVHHILHVGRIRVNSLHTENNTHPKTSYFIYASIQVSDILVLKVVSQVH